MSEHIGPKNPKATVAGLATGLEGLALLIPNEILKRVCVIVAPAIAAVGFFCYSALRRYINSQRGLTVYKTMITDYEQDLQNPNISDVEKEQIKKEIASCKANINRIKIENIKILGD